MSWIRKNAFVRALRRHLGPFRLETFTIGVARECYPKYLTGAEPHAPGSYTLDGQEWAETGRTVITIRLYGLWKGKRKSLGQHIFQPDPAPIPEPPEPGE